MSKLRLEALSPAEIERVHQRTLELLERTGFRVDDAGCRQLLLRAGAHLDPDGRTIHLPPALVNEALALAPSTYTLCRSDGKRLHVGGESRHYCSLVVDPWIIDYASGKPRPPVLDDIVRHTRLGDAHPQIDILYRMDMPPSDLPPQLAYIRSLEAFASHTSKHLMALPASLESIQDWLEIAEILANGRSLRDFPLLSYGVTATSPLAFTEINAAVLRACTGHGLPMVEVDCPIAGMTSPLSFAGSLLVSNCECVFLAVMAQLMRPGTPVAYASGQSLADLHSGNNVYYNPDKMLWKIANAQMGRFYKLPVAGEAGGTMVGHYDVQAGIEGALLMLPGLACGQNLLNGLGSNYNACGMSAEMIVMQADLAALLERISAGIDVSEDKLAFDSIAAAGPGGHFLEDPLTIRMLRSGEFFTAGSFDRLGERSPNDPADSMLAHAHARVEELLAQHTPAVPPAVAEEIGRWARRKEQAVCMH